MSTRTCIVVMSHGAKSAEETFNRHLPFWDSHKGNMLVYCPLDKPMSFISPQLLWGKASHHNQDAINRFKFLMTFLSTMDYGQFAIFEYDSFILNPYLPDVGPSGFMAVRFCEPDHKTWGSNQFFHPPFIVGRSALKCLVQEARDLNTTVELKAQGFWDRYLGILVERAGRDIAFQPLEWGKDSWSNNTIEDEHIDEVVTAVEQGVNWIHGCKSAKAYEAIKEAFDGRGK